jgi:ribonuclease PH
MIKKGVLSNADGSCRWSSPSGTVVLAAVYGPAEAMQKEERIDRAAIEVVGCVGSASLRACLEAVCLVTLHPRTAIRVVLQCMADKGSLGSALTNAASVALMDAGIQMRSVLVGCTVAVGDDMMIVSPNKSQEENARVVIDFVFDGEDIVASTCRHGVFTVEEFNKATENALEERKRIMESLLL